MAEHEVVARDHVADAKTGHQDLVDEFVGGLAGKDRVEMDDEQQIDAQILDMAGLGPERVSRNGASKAGTGCGDEVRTSNGQGCPGGLRHLGGGPDHDPVALVQSVEITQRNHGTARIIGQICEVSE